MAALDFVRTWYNHGNAEYELQKTDGNPAHRVFAFFSYFVALNWIYSTYYFEVVFPKEETDKRLALASRPGREITEDCERLKLNFFLREQMMKFKEFRPFEQLNENEKDEFEQNVKLRSRDHRGHAYDEIPEFVKNEYDAVIRLFQNIYTVRCNLYHGAKKKIKSRNMRLIDGSNNVLKHLLEVAMKKRITGINVIGEDGDVEEVVDIDRPAYEE